MFLYISEYFDSYKESRVLHIAPERALASYFSSSKHCTYEAVDFNPDGYKDLGAKKFDMCRDASRLDHGAYDLIIHNHVLEHIFCDVTSVMLHLQRALRSNGRHLFSVPFWKNRFHEEYYGPLLAKDAENRFGQRDHCRNFSRLNIESTFGMFLNVDFESFLPANRFPIELLQSINFPESSFYEIDGNTVISIGKADSVFS